MMENKENGDTDTWAEIKKQFCVTFNYWIYQVDKKKLSANNILLVQEAFSECFSILQLKKSERDYDRFSHHVEILRIVFLSKSSSHPVFNRALKQIHNK